MLGLVALLFGCQPDGVGPSDSGKGKSFDGLVGEDHPVLDTVCKYSDSVFFRSVATTNLNTNNYAAGSVVSTGVTWGAVTPTTYTYPASFYVNKCLDPDPNGPSVPGPLGYVQGNIIPCPSQMMKWGHLVMYNGYLYGSQDTTHWLDVDFSLAVGFLCDLNNWDFAISNTITIDPVTGAPNTQSSDWSTLAVNPARNQWKVAINVDSLPPNCFDLACRMSVFRLKSNGSPNENFRTTLWAINEEWDNPASEGKSNNEFAIHYCPFGCLEGPAVVPPRLDSTCVNFQVGVPGLPNCVTLNADTAGTGVTYLWSTGATTQSISVCPTATTNYSVTISVGPRVVKIKKFSVKYSNIRCGNPNQPQHKVLVCHVPPGNPNNSHTICIDWNGVPAHVARFRSPGSNPNQGHDSGCEIGRCGGNLCQ